MGLGLCLQLVEHLEKAFLLSLVFSELMPEIIDIELSGDNPMLMEVVVRWWTRKIDILWSMRLEILVRILLL